MLELEQTCLPTTMSITLTTTQEEFIQAKLQSRTEINHIQKLVEEYQEQLLAGWHDFFNG